MQYSSTLLIAAFAVTNILAHGVITEIQGANGVVMPGLSGKLTVKMFLSILIAPSCRWNSS
jgi:hypothetical protein